MAGHFCTWKAPAPSCAKSVDSLILSPSVNDIIATTVAAPMTMPSRVRIERRTLARRVPSAMAIVSRRELM